LTYRRRAVSAPPEYLQNDCPSFSVMVVSMVGPAKPTTHESQKN
jgi:hypothetical protein